MAKTPKSEPTGKSAAADAKPNEHAGLKVQDDRIADLERRIADLIEHRAAVSAVAADPAPLDEQLLEQQNERLVELQRVVESLGERLAAAQQVNARDEQFNAALRRVEAAAAAVQHGVAPAVAVTSVAVPPKENCDCGGCECVDCATCCVFEIWISHIRVDQMQNPLIDLIPPSADSNVLPTGIMEIRGFASIDSVNKIGVCIPSTDPTSYVPLHKQITDPTGPWVSVSHCVGSVMVKKGVPMIVTIDAIFAEIEDATERMQPMNRDEWGSNTGTVTLDCCYSNYSPIDIPVSLTNWGQAGGAVTGRFIVVKRC